MNKFILNSRIFSGLDDLVSSQIKDRVKLKISNFECPRFNQLVCTSAVSAVILVDEARSRVTFNLSDITKQITSLCLFVFTKNKLGGVGEEGADR